MPPSMKKELVFLRIGVVRAEKLPAMDTTLLGGKKKGAAIDAYVKLRFNGYKAKTSIIKSQSPAWMAEFWIPMLIPAVGGLCQVEVKDSDIGATDSTVDIITVNFDQVLKGQMPKIGWLHMFGLGDEANEAAASGMYSYLKAGVRGRRGKRSELRKNASYYESEWRGKILLALSVERQREDKPLPEKLMTRGMNPPPHDPQTEEYELRCAVLYGTDMANAQDAKKASSEVCIEAVVEEHVYRSEKRTVRYGAANFLKLENSPDSEWAPGILRKINGERPLTLPTDDRQLPDVIVYVCNDKGKRIAFQRFPGKELMGRSLSLSPLWQTMKPTAPFTATPGKPLPSLLMSIALCKKADSEEIARRATFADRAPAVLWPPPVTVMPKRSILQAYEVRLHLFQGKNLPAKDSNGVLDAYVVATLGGQRLLPTGKSKFQHSSIQRETTYPLWYETLRLARWLPPLAYSPDLVISVWDSDDFPGDADDFAGMARVGLRNCLVKPGGKPLEPRWLQLQGRGLYAGSGELLVMVEVIPLKYAAIADNTSNEGERPPLHLTPEADLPILQPQTNKCTVNLAILGLRGVKIARQMKTNTPVRMVSKPKKPFVELDVGQRKGGKGSQWQMRRTKASSLPSAENPSFMELLQMPLNLPTNPMFFPTINVRVRDTLYGGLKKPLLGTSSIQLDKRVSSEIASSTAFKEVPGTATVETWENERWYPVVGWTAQMLPTDPTHWSSGGTPFKELPKDSTEFDLPSQEWVWISHWVLDLTINSKDPEGWGYALGFEAGASAFSLGEWMAGDGVRRRRWYRTRQRTDQAAQMMQEKQRRATGMSKLQLLDAPEPDMQGWLFKVGSGGESDVKRCWFVLRGTTLAYFDAPTDAAARRTIDVEGSSTTFEGFSTAGRPKLYIRGTEGRVYMAEAESKAECDTWVVALNGASQLHPGVPADTDALPGSPSMAAGVRADAELPIAEDDVDLGIAANTDESEGAGLLHAERSTKRVSISTSSLEVVRVTPDAELGEVQVLEDAVNAEVAAEQDEDDAGEDAFGEFEGAAPEQKTLREDTMKEANSEALLKLRLIDLAGQLEKAYDEKAMVLNPAVVVEVKKKVSTVAASRRHDDDPDAVLATVNKVGSMGLKAAGTVVAAGSRLGKSAKQKKELYECKKKIDKIQALIKQTKIELDALLDNDIPEYMINRQTRKNALEDELGELPFDTFEIMAGTEGKEVRVAIMKAVVRVGMKGEPLPPADQALLDAMMRPQEYVVRAYILSARNLVPMDTDGASDPYIVISLGDQKVDDRKNHIDNVTTAHFYKMFEFKTRLPGDALMKIDIMDFDDFGKWSDDLIGSTTVDLEDRVFSERWKRDLSACPPVEWRNLYSPLSKHPQGMLEMWVDILDPRAGDLPPPIDIAPPPVQKWELRVIVWSGKNLPDDVDDSGLADWYVGVEFSGNKKRYTDTHFRAKNGKASWNWRFKIPVDMDSFMKHQRLTVQIWDKDITADDCGGECSVSLTRWMKRIYKRGTTTPQYWHAIDENEDKGGGGASSGTGGKKFKFKTNEGGIGSLSELAEGLLAKEPLLGEEDEELKEHKFWWPLMRPAESREKGNVWGLDGKTPPMLLISVQMVPEQKFEELPCGHGRSEPNENPVLPKPVGRLRFTLNPFAMFYQILGPKLCKKLMAFLGIIICLLLMYYMLPVIFSNVITAPITG